MKTTYHRDGTVTVWDVYQQQWSRRLATDVAAEAKAGRPNAVLQTLPQRDQDRILRMSMKKNPSRPPLGTKAYINRQSEATKRKPTQRLRKRRAKNRGGKRFPNPLGFGIFARRGSDPRLHYQRLTPTSDGKFSSNGKATIFPSKNLAVHQAEHLLMKFPVLRKYQVSVESTRGKT